MSSLSAGTLRLAGRGGLSEGQGIDDKEVGSVVTCNERTGMYERFTDRARKTMALANQEAQRFNHEYIGTEHILLGLIKEGGGVGANVLKNLDLDLRKVRLEVEKLVKSGPDMVSLGKLPQTPRAKKVIDYAIEESRNLNHSYIGTEHLLLGLLREGDGVAANVLTNMGVNLDETRAEILNLLGAVPPETHDNPSAQDMMDAIERLEMQKDEAIKDAEYDLAARCRDEAQNLRKRLAASLPSLTTIHGQPVEKQWEWVVQPLTGTADNQVQTNYGHILARISVAEAAIRELLAVCSPSADFSVIKHLTQTVAEIIDLRAYYERQSAA
jgi:ATP-dependent Clp protease ATP-binding subunit ClpA